MNSPTKNMKPSCKATHSGTCQICGSRQLLPSGNLSKHGYTVRWGFFEGVCHGAHRLPFEQSTDAIADAIVAVERDIAATEAEIAEIEELTSAINDGTNVWVQIYDTGRYTTGYRWVKARLHDLVTDNSYGCKHSKCQYTTHAKFFHFHSRNEESPLTEQINAYSAAFELHTLADWARHLNRKYAKSVLAKANAGRREWLAWQRKRVAEWTPQPLTPR